MRQRTEEVNVRMSKAEKNIIRKKAKKCGMNLSEYLRTVGSGADVFEAPSAELMQAYRKVCALHDRIRKLPELAEESELLSEIEDLLLKAYYGKEDIYGGNKDMGSS